MSPALVDMTRRSGSLERTVPTRWPAGVFEEREAAIGDDDVARPVNVDERL